MRTEIVAGRVTRPLRQAVLRPEQTPDEPIPGDDEPTAIHVAAFDATGAVVGACFVLPEPCQWRPEDGPAWRLRAMATAAHARGTGAGAAVLTGATDYVRRHGGVLLWCHARLSAEGFYLRQGWHAHADLFTEHDLPHRAMWFTIPAAGSGRCGLSTRG